MAINSRSKGASGEREFSRLVFDNLGIKLERNLDQARSGGHDLNVKSECPCSLVLDKFSFEIKRYASVKPGDIARFWAQTEMQAAEIGKIPCLAYRVDRCDWKIVLPVHFLNGYCRSSETQWAGMEWAAEISTDAFFFIVREMANGGLF